MKENRVLLKQLFLTAIIVFVTILSPGVLKANELEFQERASEIIMHSLQAEPKKSFLRKVYKALLFTPVWMHERKPSKAAKELFETIRNDFTLNKHGKLYRDSLTLQQMVQNLYAREGSIYDKISLEFKITQLYKGYTDFAYFGSINWGAFQARIANLMVNDVSTEWVLHRPDVYPIKILEKAVFGASLRKLLQDAQPTAYHYRDLQKALAKYLEIQEEGGWEPVYLSGKLSPGIRDRGVYSLRERLRLTGDYIPCLDSDEENLYDHCLQEAVKRFQKRHGLKADAVVGPVTLRTLNVPVSKRITTIRLNLDRLKWLNVRPYKRHIIINIPDFKLYFEEDAKLIQVMKVITGKPNHPTPIFSDTVEMIVLNPYWNIPKSIIQKEMIPQLIRNPNAMKRQGIEIYDGWGKDAAVVNPKSVNWAKYRYSKTVPFRFAQLPGYKNALGKVKFLFPNKFSVYMHDTPTKHLFNRSKRAFSHGCIRLHKPRELMRTFSTFNPNLDYDEAQQTLKGKENKTVALTEKVPVDIVYLTAWIDYDGVLQFRNDIYHYDEMQLKSFREW